MRRYLERMPFWVMCWDLRAAPKQDGEDDEQKVEAGREGVFLSMNMKRCLYTVLMLGLLPTLSWAGGPVCYYPGKRENLTKEDGYREVLLNAVNPKADRPIPWILQAARPNADIRAINTPFITNGVAIVLVDAMKLYGSPDAVTKLDALYEDLTTKRGFATRTTILTRDTNALLAYRWAIANPDKVNGIAALNPTVDLAAVDATKLAAAYGLNAPQLAEQLDSLNPLNGLAPLAKAGIEIFHIHAESDSRSPIERNSEALQAKYRALNGKAELKTIKGGGMKSLLVKSDQFGAHGRKGLIKDAGLMTFLEKYCFAGEAADATAK